MAVLLPDAVREALAGEIERLRALARGVAWVAPDNLHVTLKFLGDVAPGRLAEIDAVLTASTTTTTTIAFALEVTGVGAFPSLTRPRVVWAGIGHGARPLAALAAGVDDALAGAGFPRETRPFSGHVTLGRVRAPRRDPVLADALIVSADRTFGRASVGRFALVRSDLGRQGARYTALRAWTLQGLPGEIAG